MPFVKYPHLEKFGNLEVEGIELGTTYVFPKIDGTNASVWLEDGVVQAGSRNRHLTLEQDNAGFLATIKEDPTIKSFLTAYPHLRLFGEWLVPHSINGYREDAWRKFYVFDVQDGENFLNYDIYVDMLKEHGVTYVPCYKKIRNGDTAMFLHEAKTCRYLLKDEQPVGEGVVIKNYNWVNRFGRVTWAKVVTDMFKEVNIHAFGTGEIGKECNEEKIVDRAVTLHLIEKTYHKIVTEAGGWQSKFIPRILETVFYDLVKEELYDTLKLVNYGTVNFKSLRKFSNDKIKALKPELF
jgi:hypothetical protein